VTPLDGTMLSGPVLTHCALRPRAASDAPGTRRTLPGQPENGRFMRFRHRQKRKTLALARLLAGLDSEARKERRWEPRRAFRMSSGRV